MAAVGIQESRVTRAFQDRFGAEPTHLARAPGRLNLLGAHVDHQEGLVLPGAIDRSLFFAFRRNQLNRLRLLALDLGSEMDCGWNDLGPLAEERPLAWYDYPLGVACMLRREGAALSGLDMVFGGDLPREAGVSSSAAVEVGFLVAWNEIDHLELGRRSMAELGRKVENGYLGIGSGIMDQFASLLGKEGRVLGLDCRSLAFEYLEFPGEVRLLVVDSGVRRRLGASQYNNPLEDCREATRILVERGFEIKTLRDLGVDDLSRAKSLLSSSQSRRVEHVVRECARVSEGFDCLRDKAWARFGQLVTQSHASSRDLFGVSLPELDLLVESATRADGCLGARLSGAGLGGYVLALAEQGREEEVLAAMTRNFQRRYDRQPDSFCSRIGPGAEVWACA